MLKMQHPRNCGCAQGTEVTYIDKWACQPTCRYLYFKQHPTNRKEGMNTSPTVPNSGISIGWDEMHGLSSVVLTTSLLFQSFPLHQDNSSNSGVLSWWPFNTEWVAVWFNLGVAWCFRVGENKTGGKKNQTAKGNEMSVETCNWGLRTRELSFTPST